MKKILANALMALACTVMPYNLCNAHVYDYLLINNALEEPEKYPLLYEYEGVRELINSDIDKLTRHIILSDIKNALHYENNVYEDSNVAIKGELAYEAENKVSLSSPGDLNQKLNNFFKISSDAAPKNSIRIVNIYDKVVQERGRSKSKEEVFRLYGVVLNIKNKTNTVLNIDLSQSSATVNGSQFLIFNKRNPELSYTSRDYILLAPGDCCNEKIFFKKAVKFQKRDYLLEDVELLGKYALAINGRTVEFEMSAKVDSSKLNWKLEQGGKK